MKSFAAPLAVVAALSSSVLAIPANLEPRATATSTGKLPAVSVKGNAFFAGDERFYIRGVDYQPGGASDAKDPIADEAGCKRDVKYFKQLGVNTIRVYTVDNTANHDVCMGLLDDAGIYLALDVNTPKYSINRADPEISYNDVYLQSLFATVDAFAGYSNTLLFFSGNEVINDDATTACAPFVKATTRDLRKYISSRGYRSIPVGYSAADVDSNRLEMAQYMNCGSDDERSDFFAFNDYSWCDPSSFTKSGWDKKVKTYASYSIPLFLSEFGCNTNTREFNEIASLYDSDMTAVYSGGLVYEYSEEGSKYGLVDITSGSAKPLDDFDTLKTKLAATKAPTGDGGYLKNGVASKCPGKSSTWNVTWGESLPSIPEPAKKYMSKGAGKGPGLKGDGSQTAGTKSSGIVSAGAGGASATSTNSKGAAASLRVPEFAVGPYVCGLVVLASSLLGATLL